MSTEVQANPVIPTAETIEPLPSLAENLARMADRIGRLEAETGQLAGTRTYPEWWHRETVPERLVIEQLHDPETEPARVSEFFDLFNRERLARDILTGNDT